jgi:hypothetical protein
LHIILSYDQGYQSSLVAANLQQLGLSYATDLDGRIHRLGRGRPASDHPGPQPATTHSATITLGARNAAARVIVCSPAGAVRRHITGQIAALGAAHAPTEET